jgi:hypothetical protein
MPWVENSGDELPRAWYSLNTMVMWYKASSHSKQRIIAKIDDITIPVHFARISVSSVLRFPKCWRLQLHRSINNYITIQTLLVPWEFDK